MNNLTEEKLLELARVERPKLPDFDTMWHAIQMKKEHSNVKNAAVSERGLVRSRKRLVSVALVAASIIVATPVVAAGVSMGWQELFSKLGIHTVMNTELGNRLDIKAASGDISLGLHGVVTDDQKMDILFTMDVPSLPDYDAVEFGHQAMINAQGKAIPVQALIRKDSETNRLIGLLETENTLGDRQEQFKLSLKNMLFYKYKATELPVSPASFKENDRIDSSTRFGTLQIVSVQRENDSITIRYKVPSSQPKADSKLNPSLLLKMGDREITPSYSATLPTENLDVLFNQDTFRVSDDELKSAKLYFSHLDVAQTIEGTWDASFEADGTKASQAIYRKQLDSASVANDSDMDLRELVVTPLEIRLMYNNKFETKSPDLESVDYAKKQIVLNGKTIDGGVWSTNKSGWYLRFRLREWYKDWSQASMKLLLSDAVITKRSKAWLPLEAPLASKQIIQTELDGFKVAFTYYKQGEDLIVESQCDDPNFLGVAQTSVKVAGETVRPEMRNPSPPGANSSNKKVDKYPGLLSKQLELQLNPGFYVMSDKNRKTELNVQ